MDEEKARDILGKSIIVNSKREWEIDDLQPSDKIGYIRWENDLNYVTIDSDLTIEQLEALVWWMKNKKG